MSRMFYSNFLRDQVIVDLNGYTLYESSYKKGGKVEVVEEQGYYKLEIYENDVLAFSVCAKDISVKIFKGIYTENDIVPVGDEYVEALLIQVSEVNYKK